MTWLTENAGKPLYLTLREELAKADCFEAASAWVRVTGLDLIWKELAEFLEQGGICRIVVGIDRDNTSLEALQALAWLAKENQGAQCFVRHDEASVIFHPKIYRFAEGAERRLYVGSHNLTGAGLALNDEVALKTVHQANDELDGQAKYYFDVRCDDASDLVQALTFDVCEELFSKGYVRPEKKLAGKLKRRDRQRRAAPLFGKSKIQRLPIRGIVPKFQNDIPSGDTLDESDIEPAVAEAPADWDRVFMRLKLARGTQSQMPKNVFIAFKDRMDDADLGSPLVFVDRTTGTDRKVSPAGNGNTYKFETKLEAEEELLVKFEFIGSTLMATFLDSATPEGATILSFLNEGLEADPPETLATKPSDIESSTLYRFA